MASTVSSNYNFFSGFEEFWLVNIKPIKDDIILRIEKSKFALEQMMLIT